MPLIYSNKGGVLNTPYIYLRGSMRGILFFAAAHASAATNCRDSTNDCCANANVGEPAACADGWQVQQHRPNVSHN